MMTVSLLVALVGLLIFIVLVGIIVLILSKNK